MIANPENPFELLQNDVAAKLMATSPFDTIKFPDGSSFKVLTEDEGDIQFEFDALIAGLGLAIVVQAPTGKIGQPDIPGPLINDLGFDVWVSEAPVFNREEFGTQLRLSKAMTIVMGALHLWLAPSLATDAGGSIVFCSGFDKHRERVYNGEADKTGRLIISRIVHFQCPQVAAQISET